MRVNRCVACGCTPEKPCDGGCAMANEEQTHCTQCVYWGVLADPPPGRPHPLREAFPHGLVPLREIVPFRFTGPGEAGRRGLPGVRIDLRRMDEEAVTRLAFIAAPDNDGTAAEFLEKLGRTIGGMMVPLHGFVATIGALSLEGAAAMRDQAVALAAELRAKGGMPHGR